jgi:hypothetical protein
MTIESLVNAYGYLAVLIWAIYLYHRKRRHRGTDEGSSGKGKCHLNLEARGRGLIKIQ